MAPTVFYSFNLEPNLLIVGYLLHFTDMKFKNFMTMAVTIAMAILIRREPVI